MCHLVHYCAEAAQLLLFGLVTRGGWHQDDLVAQFHVSQSSVSKLLRKSRVHGYVKVHPGSGRPHVTDANDDAYIINET